MYPYYFLNLSLKSGKNIDSYTDLTVYNDGDWLLKPKSKDDYIILNNYNYSLIVYNNKIKNLTCGKDNGNLDIYSIILRKN